MAGGRLAYPVLIAALLTALTTTFLVARWLIRRLRGTSAMAKDLNKPGRPLVPEMGGLAVLIGFYTAVTLLVLAGPEDVPPAVLQAALVAILGAGFVGVVDDLFRLRQRAKAVLPFLFALPLASAVFQDPQGGSVLLNVDIGIWIVPVLALGITSAANAANLLEGFNGLGAGLGIIMTVTMIGITWATGDPGGMVLLVPLLGALVAFLWFNGYPARIFPGDSLTLLTGATIAAAAIISHTKTYGALLFLPMIVEFFLKARNRFRAENFGEIGEDGRLHYRGRSESIAHLIMKVRPMREPYLVATIWVIQGVVCLAVFLAVVLLA